MDLMVAGIAGLGVGVGLVLGVFAARLIRHWLDEG